MDPGSKKSTPEEKTEHNPTEPSGSRDPGSEATLHEERDIQNDWETNRTEDGQYEGGKEMAFVGPDHHARLLHSDRNCGDLNGSAMSTVLPSAQVSVEPVGLKNQATAPGISLEDNRERHSREKSDLEFGMVGGLTLERCGPVLFQRLLEVSPLRSKTTGRRNKSSMYPLPTSRSILKDGPWELSECGLSWLQCTVIR
eukprot:Skav200449  [mRNA]  locus=scaffold1922:173908:174501:- [translate_table: standard]